MTSKKTRAPIWLFAFGYFAAYVPYSALTKALSSGALGPGKLSGFSLLPVATAASAAGMFVTISLLGWWRHADHVDIAGLRLPRPGPWTFLSGLSTAAILLTTTLAYTFEGASIVFMMLLMRGGVLVIAPIVDLLSGRRVRWFSWVALALSLGALADALFGGSRLSITLAAALDVAVYLLGYFVRLRFMSHLAKGSVEANRKYFVEEQMVATPLALALLGVWAAAGVGEVARALRDGFLTVPTSAALGWVVVVGICSQGTGVFGGLVLLDPRENSFAVPVNRAASVIAGLLATWLAARFLGGASLGARDLAGAILVGLAIAALTLGPRFDRAPGPR